MRAVFNSYACQCIIGSCVNLSVHVWYKKIYDLQNRSFDRQTDVATIARCYETLSAVIDVRAVIHMHKIYKEIRKTTFGSVEIRISIYIKRNCVKIVIFFLPRWMAGGCSTEAEIDACDNKRPCRAARWDEVCNQNADVHRNCSRILVSRDRMMDAEARRGRWPNRSVTGRYCVKFSQPHPRVPSDRVRNIGPAPPGTRPVLGDKSTAQRGCLPDRCDRGYNARPSITRARLFSNFARRCR